MGCHAATDLLKEAPGEGGKCPLTYGLDVLIHRGVGGFIFLHKICPRLVRL